MDKILQTMDANINRAGEGLRVVEEIARFVLQNKGLTRELKEIRHTLSGLSGKLSSSLLDSRDVERDVGKLIDTDGEMKREGCLGLARANLKRTQEALRALEEFSKLKNSKISFKFEELRFRIYGLEKKIYEKLQIENRKSKIEGLYVIIDLELFKQDCLKISEEVIEGGASLIQLRGKAAKDSELFETGQALRQTTKKSKVMFVVNDRPDLTLALEADGVHLGQDDLPVGIARRLLGANKIIGVSTHSLDEAIKAEEQGANYIGFGPIFSTSTKPDLLSVGTSLLKEVKNKIGLPVMAIGGINEENIQKVIEAGADGAACASCFKTKNIKQAAWNLSKKFAEK